MPATSVDLVIARALWGAFQPHSGPLLLGCYRPTSVLGFLMWFGRTWWGRAGPKVISRAVTSETHFPTIKERERNYQDQTSPVSTALSQTFACVCRCVCVCFTSPPQSLPDTRAYAHSFPTLKQWRSISKCVYLQRKPLDTRIWHTSRQRSRATQRAGRQVDESGRKVLPLHTCATASAEYAC